MARLDNLFGSPWLNVKLASSSWTICSPKSASSPLTGNGGIYQLYHFIP